MFLYAEGKEETDMNNVVKTGLILTGAGILLIGAAYFLTGGELTAFNSKGNEYVAKNYESTSKVDKLIVDERANGVNIVKGDGDNITIDYFDNPDSPLYKIEEKDGVLEISRESTGIFKLINIDFSKKEMTVSVPKDFTGSVDVDLTSGSLVADGITAGDIKLENTSGSIKLNNVSSSGDLKVENTSGSIKFENLKAGGDISIENTSGSIKGTIVGKESDYSITTDVTAGSCNLGNTTGGSHKLTAETTAGSIDISFTE